MYQLLRPLLFSLPAETAHHLTLQLLKLLKRTGLLRFAASLPVTKNKGAVTLMGIEFPNRIGLAAGLDKNGEYIDALGALGFGFVEVGTVTPRPQPGNPKPRLFRIVDAMAIINRMGFNNKGVDYLLQQVEKSQYKGVLGINIGKNFDTPVEKAVDDYLLGMRKVYHLADYITVNISSPNTPGLRSLQYGEDLNQLLVALKQEQLKLSGEHKKYVPMAVKVAPDLTDEEIRDIAEILLANEVDCLIATNTTLSREGVVGLPNGAEQGGLSGAPLTALSTSVIAKFHQHLNGKIPIIGVGGVGCGEDAREKLAAGAELVQLYSGLIYHGASLVKQVIQATDS